MSQIYELAGRCECDFPTSVTVIGLEFEQHGSYCDFFSAEDYVFYNLPTVEIDTIFELKNVRISFDGKSYVIPRLLVDKIMGRILPTEMRDSSDDVTKDVKPDVVVGA